MKIEPQTRAGAEGVIDIVVIDIAIVVDVASVIGIGRISRTQPPVTAKAHMHNKPQKPHKLKRVSQIK